MLVPLYEKKYVGPNTQNLRSTVHGPSIPLLHNAAVFSNASNKLK